MHKCLRIATLAALALSTTALTAQAQDKATELTAGVLGLQYTSYDGYSTFAFATGGAYFAAGFYLSPGMSIEPTVQLATVSISYDAPFDDNNESQTAITIGVALPYYFNKNWGRSGPYLAPNVAYNSYTCDGCDGVGQVSAGLALGTKVPLNDMAALRLQASFNYGFENDDVPGSTAFGASLGFSVFLK